VSVLIDPVAWRKNALGIKTDRATATIPQTATQGLFTVTGGRVVITNIVGEVTTVIGAVATNGKLISTPTTGTAVDMCAVVAITSKEAGTLLGISGTAADAMVAANAGLTTVMERNQVIPIGSIGFNTSASTTGAVKWSITWYPFDDGATLVAA
jgi:hypothetical protein